MTSADTLRPCAVDCAAPRPLCPACRRYPCADLIDTCAPCALDEINGVHTKPTVPAPRPSLVSQYLAAQRVADESVASAIIATGRAESVWGEMSATERGEADRLLREMRQQVGARGARG